MNILQICSGYDIGFNGGITNYVRSLSESIASSGHDVYVLDSQKIEGDKNSYKFDRITLDGLILKPFHLNNSLTNLDVEKIENIIKKIAPEIIHFHMMIDLPLAVINLAKKYAKVIVSLHDYSYICNRITMIDSQGHLCLDSISGSKCNTCISKLEQNPYTNLIFKKCGKRGQEILSNLLPSIHNEEKHEVATELLSSVDLLIAVSSRVKEIYQNNGLNNSNFIVNHIGNITANNFRAKKGISQDKINLAFIGYFSKYKGAELVLKLADKLDSDKFEIKIFGRIDDNYISSIESSEIITYEGVYQQKDLANILDNVDLGLVLPVWEDNAPQVVFEFINNGIPVVGTLMGGIPDFIENDKNGLLIEPNDHSITNLAKNMNGDGFKLLLQKLMLNMFPTKTVEQHNAEITDIYLGLIK